MQDGQKDAAGQPFKKAMLPHAPPTGDNTSKPSIAASPTFNSAPLKTPMPGQHAQALEVRRHLYALQVPTLLLVNAELVKGCIFLLEQHAKNKPEQAFSMEGTYSE